MKLSILIFFAASAMQAQIICPATARAIVTFSPGLKVGRDADGHDVWSWRAIVSNCTQASLPLDALDIEQAANSVGIATVAYQEAQAANTASRNRSKPIIISEIAGYGGGGVTAAIALGALHASGPWGATAVLGTLALKDVVSFFKNQAPPDFASRFAGSELLVDDISVDLNARSQAHHSSVKLLFARTKKGAVPVANVPIF